MQQREMICPGAAAVPLAELQEVCNLGDNAHAAVMVILTHVPVLFHDHMYMALYIRTCVHTYIRTYIHTYIYIYMHDLLHMLHDKIAICCPSHLTLHMW